MTALTENKRHILLELWHGPLDLYELAEGTGLPPFTVRQELKELRRSRLVAEQLTTRVHQWELTNRGHGEAFAMTQLRLIKGGASA